MSRVAGNAVDEVLRPLILRACGINPGTGEPRSDEDFALIKVDLAAQIRGIKERLFRDGTCRLEFNPNARGTLDREDVEVEAAYADLAGELKSQMQSILGLFLSGEFADQLRWSGYRVPVYVLLTGGSSTRLLHKSWHVIVTRTPTFRVANASQNSPCSIRPCHDCRPITSVAYPHRR